MRPFYLLCLCLISSLYTWAQFSGDYAPANWSITAVSPSNGTVDLSAAPETIILNGSDGGVSKRNVDVDFTIITTSEGIWSFDWTYHSNDTYGDPSFDIAGVIINNKFTQLSNDNSGVDQTGSYIGTYLPAGTKIGFKIRTRDNIEGNAVFTISNFKAPSSTLPLKLLSFSVLPKEGVVLLQWNTASEVNTSHFEVERSTDGRNFFVIGKVLAGQRDGQYTYNDKEPVNAVSFYRLRMVDIDSRHSYSGTVAVRLSLTSKLQLYPNPARGATSVTILSKGSGVETFRLFDANGKCLKTGQVMVAEGINRKPIDLNGLPGGIYFIFLRSSGTCGMLLKE